MWRGKRPPREDTVWTNTKTVTDLSFDSQVLRSKKPILVDFWAEWCGPCKAIAPVLEVIATEHKEKLLVAKLNIDKNPQTTRKYKIQSVPTMLLFAGGDLVRSVAGAQPKAAILTQLAAYL
jgi:thioredoxin 1